MTDREIAAEILEKVCKFVQMNESIDRGYRNVGVEEIRRVEAETVDALLPLVDTATFAVCREPGCAERDGLNACSACDLKFCSKHITFGTQSDGEPRHLCVDCTPREDVER